MQDCSVILRNARLPKSNISKVEFRALKFLNNNLEVVVLKANKGGGVVILEK